MSMEVLLMMDVPGLGTEGEVVHVSDGYARNYILPRKMGAPVTDITRKKLEKIRRDREADKQVRLVAAKEAAAKLKGVSCTISARVAQDQKLYGSITVADISKILNEQGVELDKNYLLLDQPIKELGVYDVKVVLHPEVETSVKVWVVEE